MSVLLEVSNLQVAYGHIEAVQGIDFHVDAGEICSLVGANGAGKSTTLLALSGLVEPKSGTIRFEGEDLAKLKTHQGAYRRKDKAAIASDLERVLTLFPRLQERLGGLAGNLSGGEQQMLAIGRALLAKPRLLLLDEPSMGLAPIIVQDIFRKLREINQEGLTIFLVEQNVRQALKIAQHGYVLESGKIVLHDTGDKLLKDPKVLAAYLGG